jgi:transcriptional regulator with XRE-family HTH domain
VHGQKYLLIVTVTDYGRDHMRMNKKPDETMAALLTRWAKSESLTDEQLARTLGVSLPTISHWRCGHSAPNWNKWHLIADRSGRSVEDIALAIARGVKSLTATSDDATATSVKSRIL